jgi:LEA14-like dessication related protein
MRKLHQKKINTHYKILFLLIVSTFFISCLNWIVEKPSFTLRGISVRPLSFTEINILLNLEIHNPNSLNLTLKSFEYKVYLKNEEVGNGHLDKEFVIPSSAATQIQVPVTAKFKDLSTSLKAIFTQDNLPYKIEGMAKVGTIWGSLDFPFSNEGQINLKN